MSIIFGPGSFILSIISFCSYLSFLYLNSIDRTCLFLTEGVQLKSTVKVLLKQWLQFLQESITCVKGQNYNNLA